MYTAPDLQPYVPSADDSDDEVAQAVAPHHPQQSHQPFPSSASCTSSDTLELPPRKRLRMTENALKGKRADTTPERDPDYYMSDGSCVLLVDNVLFNVHRTLLARDSSFFSSLFIVPSPGGSPQDGSSDENPLVLHDDSAPAFRNFLWVLYALPHEIASGADLRRLIDIARTANKYGFKSVETWALDSIVDALSRKPVPSHSAFTFPMGTIATTTSSATNMLPPLVASNAQVIELVRLAQLCSHKSLLDNMVNALRRAMHSGVQSAYLALTLADELGLRALQGEAYLEVLLRHFPDHIVVLSDSQRDCGLRLGEFEDGITSGERLFVSRTQQLRLLAGHYRLVSTWEALRRVHLPIEHAPACELHWQKSSCAQSWLEFWRDKSSNSSAVLGSAPADVLGRLKAMGREFERLGTTTMMHPECRNCARRAIGERVKEVGEGLAGLFAEDFE